MTITLTSLPNELIIGIFKYLNHADLYTQSKTCRTFHFVTLHILFQRHFNGFPSHKLDLDLDVAVSHSLLPALQSALFIDGDIHHIHIIFATDVSLLFYHIRVLTRLVKRLKSVTSLHLFLSRLRDSYIVQNRQAIPTFDVERLAGALQKLMHAAFSKGCNDLTFSTESVLEPARGRNPRRKLTHRLSGLVLRPKMALKSFGSAGAGVASCHSACIVADLLFQPCFLDWTLYFLNHGHLTTLIFRWSGFSWFSLRDILPKIHVPRLECFTYIGWMGPFRDLISFAQRHSKTITSITLNTTCPDYLDLLTPALSGLGKSTKLQLDFPKLRHIELPSPYFPWFFSAVTSNPQRGALRCLPNLAHITILVRSLPLAGGQVVDLGSELAYVSQLVRRGTGSTQRPNDWLSSLTFDLSGIELTPSFVAWCQSSSSDPSTSHILHLLKNMSIKNFATTPKSAHVEEEMFQALPNFLTLFPNLTTFHLSSVEVNSLRKRLVDSSYWREVSQQHPALEVVKFNDALEVNMVDLVGGRLIVL
ncbi:hypothetical protein BDN72DRAFT_495508 [Pluteus cervinus]|uniref:Uncharacterized protein n=1 Tax=Pluteus cervinus TaxID=181527 RepID=A0ACD3AZ18_9AGAR|nr:hypothetical protein BDN72DRAFT_495508 [Pluteus cervinus]